MDRLRARAGRVARWALVGLAPFSLSVALCVMTLRGPESVSWAALALAAAATAAALAWALVRDRRLALAMLPGAGALAALLLSLRGAPIEPAPAPSALPPASPPASLQLHKLETGRIHRSLAFAVRGGSPFEARDFAMNALLVRHPAGDLLIDAGIGRGIEEQLESLPRLFRALTVIERGPSAAEQLARAGYDRSRLRGVLLTHAHWDHVSGVPELPEVPVLVSREERAGIDEGGVAMDFARSLSGVRYETYAFEGGPYAGFERSHDVYGDGSLVVVPLPGHTPGSIAVFICLPGERRYLLVGDLVWQLEGIREGNERPLLSRLMADAEPGEVRAGIARVAGLSLAFPALSIVPAHDARAYEGIAPLPALAGP